MASREPSVGSEPSLLPTSPPPSYASNVGRSPLHGHAVAANPAYPPNLAYPPNPAYPPHPAYLYISRVKLLLISLIFVLVVIVAVLGGVLGKRATDSASR